MKIDTAVIISLLAVVALVAELVLYFMLGMGASLARSVSVVSGLAVVFVGAMIVTFAAAVLAPVGAVIELVTKKKKLGSWILFVGLAVVTVGYVVMASVGSAATSRVSGTKVGTSASVEANAPSNAETEGQRLARAYMSSSLTLERVRVAAGEHFGQRVDGVFGTIVNNGTESLREVRIRLYFLDSAGRRIGETEHSPVFVYDISIGDNTPLRGGYRRDFGYTVTDSAPSGWAKQVDAEIVNIRFLKK